jgi:hypothetical protein
MEVMSSQRRRHVAMMQLPVPLPLLRVPFPLLLLVPLVMLLAARLLL